jgi:hypothetical protein
MSHYPPRNPPHRQIDPSAGAPILFPPPVDQLPTAPSLHTYWNADHTHCYDAFSFTLWMLPSINEKHDRSQRVRPTYRARELHEIERITLQREAVGWTCQPHDRYILFYRFAFTSELRQDLHNPLKPTCDLLGDGRWETRKKKKVFVPHGQVLWNDNRVTGEYLMKVTREPDDLWCYITLFRYHASMHQSLYSAILTEQSPRFFSIK